MVKNYAHGFKYSDVTAPFSNLDIFFIFVALLGERESTEVPISPCANQLGLGKDKHVCHYPCIHKQEQALALCLSEA
jgi:hypothetical protein